MPNFEASRTVCNARLSRRERNACKAAFGAKAETLDTPAHTSHTLRIQTLQRILYKVMADNKLDALVYVYTTIPPPIVLPSRVAAVYNAAYRAARAQGGNETVRSESSARRADSQNRSGSLSRRRRQLGGES